MIHQECRMKEHVASLSTFTQCVFLIQLSSLFQISNGEKKYHCLLVGSLFSVPPFLGEPRRPRIPRPLPLVSSSRHCWAQTWMSWWKNQQDPKKWSNKDGVNDPGKKRKKKWHSWNSLEAIWGYLRLFEAIWGYLRLLNGPGQIKYFKIAINSSHSNFM